MSHLDRRRARREAQEAAIRRQTAEDDLTAVYDARAAGAALGQLPAPQDNPLARLETDTAILRDIELNRWALDQHDRFNRGGY